ncbi:uncharacterized protein LOC106168824 isoform X2 [Lingula anatina]|nr:uncharacterized protein LOC106168824 isoform X2 [Lingula anatina]|eukprot:XP_013403476.1 uncharacterized protein LOC106168824 isoform X2 [Lingula anatina]
MKIQPICYYQKKLFCLTHDDKQYLFLAQFKNKILGHIKNDDFYKVKVDFFCITSKRMKKESIDYLNEWFSTHHIGVVLHSETCALIEMSDADKLVEYFENVWRRQNTKVNSKHKKICLSKTNKNTLLSCCGSPLGSYSRHDSAKEIGSSLSTKCEGGWINASAEEKRNMGEHNSEQVVDQDQSSTDKNVQIESKDYSQNQIDFLLKGQNDSFYSLFPVSRFSHEKLKQKRLSEKCGNSPRHMPPRKRRKSFPTSVHSKHTSEIVNDKLVLKRQLRDKEDTSVTPSPSPASKDVSSVLEDDFPTRCKIRKLLVHEDITHLRKVKSVLQNAPVPNSLDETLPYPVNKGSTGGQEESEGLSHDVQIDQESFSKNIEGECTTGLHKPMSCCQVSDHGQPTVAEDQTDLVKTSEAVVADEVDSHLSWTLESSADENCEDGSLLVAVGTQTDNNITGIPKRICKAYLKPINNEIKSNIEGSIILRPKQEKLENSFLAYAPSNGKPLSIVSVDEPLPAMRSTPSFVACERQPLPNLDNVSGTFLPSKEPPQSPLVNPNNSYASGNMQSLKLVSSVTVSGQPHSVWATTSSFTPGNDHILSTWNPPSGHEKHLPLPASLRPPGQTHLVGSTTATLTPGNHITSALNPTNRQPGVQTTSLQGYWQHHPVWGFTSPLKGGNGQYTSWNPTDPNFVPVAQRPPVLRYLPASMPGAGYLPLPLPFSTMGHCLPVNRPATEPQLRGHCLSLYSRGTRLPLNMPNPNCVPFVPLPTFPGSIPFPLRSLVNVPRVSVEFNMTSLQLPPMPSVSCQSQGDRLVRSVNYHDANYTSWGNFQSTQKEGSSSDTNQNPEYAPKHCENMGIQNLIGVSGNAASESFTHIRENFCSNTSEEHVHFRDREFETENLQEQQTALSHNDNVTSSSDLQIENTRENKDASGKPRSSNTTVSALESMPGICECENETLKIKSEEKTLSDEGSQHQGDISAGTSPLNISSISSANTETGIYVKTDSTTSNQGDSCGEHTSTCTTETLVRLLSSERLHAENPKVNNPTESPAVDETNVPETTCRTNINTLFTENPRTEIDQNGTDVNHNGTEVSKNSDKTVHCNGGKKNRMEMKYNHLCAIAENKEKDDDDGGDESALALLFKSQKLFKRAMKKMTERCTFVEGKIKRLQAEVCTTRVETEELERELATLQRF